MKEVTAKEAKEIIEKNIHSNDFELIDVRTPEEYEEGYIKHSKLVPLNKIENYVKKCEKNKTYLIYCRTGNRSSFAQQIFLNHNLNAINMKGGIIAWISENYEIENYSQQ